LKIEDNGRELKDSRDGSFVNILVALMDMFNMFGEIIDYKKVLFPHTCRVKD
jgi:hypothetical protein